MNTYLNGGKGLTLRVIAIIIIIAIMGVCLIASSKHMEATIKACVDRGNTETFCIDKYIELEH